MGYGWTHNYVIKAAERSDAPAGLGKNTPLDMASTLVGTRAAYRVYTRAPDSAYAECALWAITALISEWTIDNLCQNAVNFTMGAETVQFVKQPTGADSFSYVPQAGVTLTLTKDGGGAYFLQQRHANTLNFDSATKRVAAIVDPYGKTMTFHYLGDGRLDYIDEAIGRVLDFAYNDNKKLVKVNDKSGGFGPARCQFHV